MEIEFKSQDMGREGWNESTLSDLFVIPFLGMSYVCQQREHTRPWYCHLGYFFPPKQTCAHGLWWNMTIMRCFRFAQGTRNSRLNKTLGEGEKRKKSSEVRVLFYATRVRFQGSWSECGVSQCLHFIAVAFREVFISALPAFVSLPVLSSELWRLYKNVECKGWWDNCCRKCNRTFRVAWHHSCMRLRVQRQLWSLICLMCFGGDWWKGW